MFFQSVEIHEFFLVSLCEWNIWQSILYVPIKLKKYLLSAMVSDLKRQLHSHNALLWYYSHLKAISGKSDLKDAMLSESKTAQSYIITWTRSPTRWLIGHSGNTWFSGRVRWGDWQINRLYSFFTDSSYKKNATNLLFSANCEPSLDMAIFMQEAVCCSCTYSCRSCAFLYSAALSWGASLPMGLKLCVLKPLQHLSLHLKTFHNCFK